MNNDGLPDHIEETVRAIEQLHVQHQERASALDRLLDRSKAHIGQSSFVFVFIFLVAIWIAINSPWGGSIRWDPPPFAYLQVGLALLAVCIAILILATQTRADRLANHREKLILHLAFLSERKTAKIIALLEELRRDIPQVRNRIDREAEQMTKKADANAVSEALQTVAPDETSPSDIKP